MSISIDLTQLISILTTLVQTFSTVSSLVKQYSSIIIEALPANTVLWFWLAIGTTVGYGVASLGAKVCKVLAVVFWAVFFVFLAKELLHI